MTLRYLPLPLRVVALAPLYAQSPTAEARFEVASVRRNESGTSRGTFRIPESGQVSITNATVKMLVSLAFDAERFTLVAAANSPLLGEGLTDGPKFDVQAKPPDNALPGRQRLMLQVLLADRFHLRVHRETRPTPVYVLKMVRDGRFGPQLARTEDRCVAWRAALVEAVSEIIAAPLYAGS